MRVRAEGMTAQAEALPSSPLPFVAIAPCRIVDTRTGDLRRLPPAQLRRRRGKDVRLPRQHRLPGSACNSRRELLNIQFRPMTVLAFLTAYPTGTTMPVVSTIVGNPAGWTANAAVVPAGTGGAIDVYCQYAGRVIIDVNGYYGPQGVVTSLTGGASTLTGDVTLAAGSNVTITPSGQTLTIAGPTALPPSGAAGGSLTGSYPNPGLAAGAVGTAHIQSNAVTAGQILGRPSRASTGRRRMP